MSLYSGGTNSLERKIEVLERKVNSLCRTLIVPFKFPISNTYEDYSKAADDKSVTRAILIRIRNLKEKLPIAIGISKRLYMTAVPNK